MKLLVYPQHDQSNLWRCAFQNSGTSGKMDFYFGLEIRIVFSFLFQKLLEKSKVSLLHHG